MRGFVSINLGSCTLRRINMKFHLSLMRYETTNAKRNFAQRATRIRIVRVPLLRRRRILPRPTIKKKREREREEKKEYKEREKCFILASFLSSRLPSSIRFAAPSSLTSPPRRGRDVLTEW